MEVSGQRHALAALPPPPRETITGTRLIAGWVDLQGRYGRFGKTLASTEIRTFDHPDRSHPGASVKGK